MMAGKKDNDYFALFVTLVDYSCEAAQMLKETMQDYRAENLPEKITAIHQVEHAADTKKHDLMEQLAREFITPIEREDIISLTQEIDNVTDSVEDVMMRLYMFNRKTLRDEAVAFADIVSACCKALKSLMEEFRNFRKSTTIHDLIVEINRLEEEGDKLYTSAIRNLYVNCSDPIEVVAWTETFDILEKCCDSCEHTANQVESTIMKNT